MPEKQQPSVQRSFRLSPRTIELLDAAAAAGGESRNALADRLLGEAVRLERHPLIRFRRGAAGRRQPLIVGTRLYVHQVMSTLRASRGDIDEAAAYLGIAPRSDEPGGDAEVGGCFVDVAATGAQCGHDLVHIEPGTNDERLATAGHPSAEPDERVALEADGFAQQPVGQG